MALNNNRDFKRINKSDETLHANILSLLSSESISKVKSTMKRKFDSLTEAEYNKQIELLDLALDSQAKSSTIFNKCQNNLRKVVTECVAKAHHNFLISSIQNNESPTSIRSIPNSIATSDIVSKYKQMIKPACSGDSDSIPSINTAALQAALQPTSQFEKYLDTYCKEKFSTIPLSPTYFPPFEVTKFLYWHDCNTVKHGKKTITVRKLILAIL